MYVCKVSIQLNYTVVHDTKLHVLDFCTQTDTQIHEHMDRFLYTPKTFVLWGGGGLYKNYRQSQTESKLCMQQIKVSQKNESCIVNDQQHCRKRRKCWLPAFSPFPTMFSRRFFFRGC